MSAARWRRMEGFSFPAYERPLGAEWVIEVFEATDTLWRAAARRATMPPSSALPLVDARGIQIEGTYRDVKAAIARLSAIRWERVPHGPGFTQHWRAVS